MRDDSKMISSCCEYINSVRKYRQMFSRSSDMNTRGNFHCVFLGPLKFVRLICDGSYNRTFHPINNCSDNTNKSKLTTIDRLWWLVSSIGWRSSEYLSYRCNICMEFKVFERFFSTLISVPLFGADVMALKSFFQHWSRWANWERLQNFHRQQIHMEQSEMWRD